jgi:uncharacterized SAM-binding protein YcdF (DUF218 family)
MTRTIGLGGRLVTLALLAVLLYVGVTFTQVWWASQQDDDSSAHAIIVLGAAQYDGRPSPALQARLDHAADLFDAGRAPVVWLTGGNRPGDRTTEAKSGYDYLRERGIPDEALQLEVQGRNTWESLAATARFLRARNDTDVLLVSHPYHSFRLAGIAGEVGLSPHVSPTTAGVTQSGDNARALVRETAAVSLGRLVGYRRLTNLDRFLQPEFVAHPLHPAPVARPLHPASVAHPPPLPHD